MIYTTNGSMDITGTSLMGYISTTYDRLVEVFGEPTHFESGDGKVTAEWDIEFTDDEGDVHKATVYDWKQYEDGTPDGKYDWHIGGRTGEVVGFVQDLVLGKVS
jgi:hypothetical protein